MSYRGASMVRRRPVLMGLGAAADTTITDPRDVSGIVPSTCAALKTFTRPPSTIKDGQVLVVTYTLVKASPEKVAQALALILGPNGGGGPVLIDYLSRSTTGLAYKFVAGGFWEDTKSDQSLTRGTIWLALSPKGNRGLQALKNDATNMLLEAGRRVGIRTSKTVSNSDINFIMSHAALASGRSDDQLKQAAYEAASAGGQFAALVSYAVSGAAVGRTAATLSTGFETRAQKMLLAQQTVEHVDEVVSQIDGRISAALDMPKDQNAQAVAMLDQARVQVEQLIQVVDESVRAIPQFLGAAVQSQQERILNDVRRAILSRAESEIRRKHNLEIAREYARCWTLQRAATEVTGAVTRVQAAIAQGAQAAQWLRSRPHAVEDALKELNEAKERIMDAYNQLPLGWLLRRYWFMPGWAWLTVGGVGVIGGAFGIRAVRKRGKK